MGLGSQLTNSLTGYCQLGVVTCFSSSMTRPSSWSSKPRWVTVKSTTAALALTSGLYAGLASLVVM